MGLCRFASPILSYHRNLKGEGRGRLPIVRHLGNSSHSFKKPTTVICIKSGREGAVGGGVGIRGFLCPSPVFLRNSGLVGKRRERKEKATGACARERGSCSLLSTTEFFSSPTGLDTAMLMDSYPDRPKGMKSCNLSHGSSPLGILVSS